MLSISSCVIWSFGLLPLKRLCLVHFPISSLFADFFEFRVFVFLLPVYSDYLPIVRYLAGKDFLPFCGLPLQSDDHVFCCA
jgi:hypothetical protein